MTWFACGRGHRIAAALSWANDSDIDLTGYFCPVCMGSVVGHGEINDSRILAPMQNQPETPVPDGAQKG
jgi:hypothetical protein